jgi:hypothetical protein
MRLLDSVRLYLNGDLLSSHCFERHRAHRAQSLRLTKAEGKRLLQSHHGLLVDTWVLPQIAAAPEMLGIAQSVD